MKGLMQKLIDRLNLLAMRERALVMAMVAGAIIILWDTVARAPIDAERMRLDTEIAKIQTDIKATQLQLDAVEKVRAQDPDAPNKALKAKLAFDIAQLDEKLKELTAGIIEPKKMTRLLEEVLAQNKDLMFVGLRNMPGEPLMEKGKDKKPDEKAPEGEVFKHGVQLVFRGKYLSTLSYLKTLEQLPWRLYWGGLDYQVDEYPDANVIITVYTLSLADGWVGV